MEQSTVNNNELVTQQTNFIQKQNQIAEIKYKVYAFILVLVLFRFRWALEAKIANVDSLYALVDDTRNQIDVLDVKIKNDTENKKIVWIAKENYDQVVNCINKRICDGVTANKEIAKNIGNLRTFYLTNKLEADKMNLDQKLVLKAIDDYLLKKEWQSIWQIQSITYGDQIDVNKEKKIYKLPINVQIEFFNKDDFVQFILNTEKYLDPSLKYRVLFKINSMNYNIANYESLQKVTMMMEVFYYR